MLTGSKLKTFTAEKSKKEPLKGSWKNTPSTLILKIANGEDIGPLPTPTPTGQKRHYMYNFSDQEPRPLAPSTPNSVDIDDRSTKPQAATKIQNPTRSKQDLPNVKALALATEGAAQTSNPRIAPREAAELEVKDSLSNSTRAQAEHNRENSL